ncbi:MAG TPA: efflux RND transporter periplasmic adaptor subunit, partial [bacterium]|nr:efflux RND transporter periplasmic adaptor subunit [bacterium]
ESKTYFCPMHPTYVSDRPGDCPICNMKLVSKAKAKEGKERKILYYRHPMGQPDLSPVPKKDSMGMDYIPVYEGEVSSKATTIPGYAEIQLPAERQQLIGVKTSQAEKRKMIKEIRTFGQVVYDPELYTARQEFLSAVKSLPRAEAGGHYHEPPERTRALVEAARTRLRIFGMSEEEINELEKRTVQDQSFILPVIGETLMSSPEKFAWVYAVIYEYELPFVKIGNKAKIFVPTFAERIFEGEIHAIDPVLDPMTRSVRARIRVANPEGLLRPQMYVDAVLQSDLGELLSVPEESVMFTGERALAFVAKPGGLFEPREVKVGAKAASFYEIKGGLTEGEWVVTNGNFLIDSESRLKGALQGMTAGEPIHG